MTATLDSESVIVVGAGIGVPMCLISGEHAAAAVREDATGTAGSLLGRALSD